MNELHNELRQLVKLLKSNNKIGVANYFEKISESQSTAEYLEQLKSCGSITQYANFNQVEFSQLAKIQKLASSLIEQASRTDDIMINSLKKSYSQLRKKKKEVENTKHEAGN